jgi:hypothetical protein
MKSFKGMKSMSSTVIVIILFILLVICLLFDGNMMEGFFVLPPPPPPRMLNTNTIPRFPNPNMKSAQDLKQMERTVPPKNITLNIKVNDKEKAGLATGGAALMLLNSGKTNPNPTRRPLTEGFANPGDCLLPIPLGNDTYNSNTIKFAPTHYKKNGKPVLFDMVEQPTDPKYPLLVLP